MRKEMSLEEESELKKNPINVFTCGHADCGKLESMVFQEFKKHLFEAHKINSDGMKGNRQMSAHMDGSKWFSYNYKWTLENSGLEFYQYVRMGRQKNDPMRFEE